VRISAAERGRRFCSACCCSFVFWLDHPSGTSWAKRRTLKQSLSVFDAIRPLGDLISQGQKGDPQAELEFQR